MTVIYNLDDNKKNLCQHNKLQPLTARGVTFVSETMYRDIEKSFNMTHRNTSLQKRKNGLSTHKFTIGDI